LGGDQDKQPDDICNTPGDKLTPPDLTTLQTTLEAKKAQCNDPLEQDLIQDYLEDLLCTSNAQSLPEAKPERTLNLELNMDEQKLRTSIKELDPINNELHETQGIEEIPWQQSNVEQVPLPLEVPETYKETARRLGLFKPTTASMAKPKESHKKGIKTPINGTSNALATTECQLKPLPGLEYREDLEDEDPTTEPNDMIVENHGIEQGQEVQTGMLRLNQSTNKPTQRGVKHDLSDPHTQENEHLIQEEVQGLEHMVVVDHGPKKGMAPRLKPQINPLFFPFATCLPTFSTPQDHDLKEGRDVTLKAHSQSSLMGKESNDSQDKPKLSHQESSTVNTITTSPWPDQWQLEGLSDDILDLEDPWPDLEGTNAWKDTEGLDLTDDTPYATPWGLVGEPQWITELDDAIEPEPEENLFPLKLHYPDKNNRSKLEGELSPHGLNDMPDPKETLPLQNEQRNKEFLDERNPEHQIAGSTSDDKEGTMKINQLPTHQESTCPTSDDEEGTTIVESISLDTRTSPQNKEVPAMDNTTKRRNPYHNQESISHQGMTQRWMTQLQNITYQPERDKPTMPLLQTSAHYPKMSKQNDRSLSNRSFGTLSASPIQEHADRTTVLPSAMTHDTDHDQLAMPPMTDATGTDQSKTPPSSDQKRTTLTTLGIIITTILLIVQGNQTRHGTINQVSEKAMTSQRAKKLMQRTTQNAECPRYEHWTQEEPQYKSPPGNATSSPSKLPDFSQTPTAPNNTPITSPCLPPSPTPPLQLRSEDSGSKEKLTTTPGKATTSSIHGGATTTAAIPGTVAR